MKWSGGCAVCRMRDAHQLSFRSRSSRCAQSTLLHNVTTRKDVIFALANAFVSACVKEFAQHASERRYTARVCAGNRKNIFRVYSYILKVQRFKILKNRKSADNIEIFLKIWRSAYFENWIFELLEFRKSLTEYITLSDYQVIGGVFQVRALLEIKK